MIHPTDALRLEAAKIIDPAAFLFQADELMKGDTSQYDALRKAERILALAAPASPLPEGGGMTAGERAFTAWSGSSRADGTRFMWTWDEMPDEQKRRWGRIADAVLAPLPAAPTGAK